jgi:hypothetical protein
MPQSKPLGFWKKSGSLSWSCAPSTCVPSSIHLGNSYIGLNCSFNGFHVKKVAISCPCGTIAHIVNIQCMTKVGEGFAIQHLLTWLGLQVLQISLCVIVLSCHSPWQLSLVRTIGHHIHCSSMNKKIKCELRLN